MERIAILTFHSANNFGAVLQALSLQNTINKNENIQCEIIDYQPIYIKNDYTINPFNSKNNNIKKIVLSALRIKDKYLRNKLFDKFRGNYFRLSSKCENQSEFLNIANTYDKIVVGSDQIWNFSLTEADLTYLLKGVTNSVKKYAYAASVGDYHFFGNEANELKQRLLEYKKISVRETNTKSEIEEIIERDDVVVTLDPVFLTTQKDWKKIITMPKKKDYILFFKMGYSKKADAALHFAKKLSEKTGCELLMLWDQETWYRYRDVKHVGVVDPAEFLGYIEGAKYVVTNSFHATAFSIILNTPFYVETDIDRKDRVINLLSTFNLMDRGLVRGQLMENVCLEQEINWDECNLLIKKQVELSKEFLSDMISG